MSEYNNELIELPKDWEVKRLGDILLFKNGKRPNIINEEGEIPVYGANGIIGYTNDYLINYDTTIIIGRVGAAGKVHLAKGKIWVSDNAIYAINRNESKAHPNFIFYLLSYLNPGKFASKTTHSIITQKSLENFKIPLPPLEEQKKIVEILNTVDSIIIDTTNLIEKLKLLKEKTLNLLITGKIWHKEFKDTEIGKIPKNWEIVKLEEIAVDIYRYPTYYNIKYVSMNEGVPEVRAELIKENGELEDDLSKYRFISKETSKRFYRTILHEGDFVLSVRGTLGKVAIVPKFLEGANITANLMKISLNCLKCYPPFFKQFFLSDFFRKNLDNISSQTTIKTIQASKLKSIKIPLPPLEEQKKIAEILSTIDNKIETETKYLDYMKKLKEKLLAALMTGKIRVNSIPIGDLK